MTPGTAKRSQRAAVFMASIALGWLAMGCGYTLVKKTDLQAKRLADDSARIETLQQQLTALRVQHQADSARYAAVVKQMQAMQPVPATKSDSLLHAREQEIQALRDQLAKVNTEMERIKRRLANPQS